MSRLLYIAALVVAFLVFRSAAVVETHHILAAIAVALHVPAQ